MSASLRDRPDQYDAFRDVQTRLTRDFGAVPVTVVEEVVRRRVSSLEGAHVTVFLPIFVEQASRHELSHLAAQPSRSAGGTVRTETTCSPEWVLPGRTTPIPTRRASTRRDLEDLRTKEGGERIPIPTRPRRVRLGGRSSSRRRRGRPNWSSAAFQECRQRTHR